MSRQPADNRVLYIMAVVQLRHRDSTGRASYDRRVATGKALMEAMRRLKRKLPDVVWRRMAGDARNRQTSLRGHSGTTVQPSDKPFPGPAA